MKDFKTVSNLIQGAFGSSPWDEYMECKSCGETYGEDQVTNKRQKNPKIGLYSVPEPNSGNCKNPNCGIDLKVVEDESDYYKQNENFGRYWDFEKVAKKIGESLLYNERIRIGTRTGSRCFKGLIWTGYSPNRKNKDRSYEKEYFGNFYYLDKIIVPKSNRNKGMGTVLLEDFFSDVWKENRGLKVPVITITDQRDEPSMNFFLKNGFEPVPSKGPEREYLSVPDNPNRIYLEKRV
jgi:hypothetical protein